jgi:NADH-quinone oxidoreductase subunit D
MTRPAEKPKKSKDKAPESVKLESRAEVVIPQERSHLTGGSGLLHTEVMTLNVGPQHPSTHGVLRVVVDMEGENVIKVVPHIGYLHTGFEKTMENRTYNQNFTFAPRMDYLHGLAYELAYALPVERLVEARVPERAQTIRVMLTELNRISSHLVFLGTGLLDLGALTPFFYTFREREAVLDLLEMVGGQRLHQGYFRVGGVARDLPDGFEAAAKTFLDDFDARVDEYERLFSGNPIFLERTQGVGVLSADVALDLGMTGPNLRASGINLDHRKSTPYEGYDTYDFDVPVRHNGDCFDRFMIRVSEMRESARIARQALQRLKPGPVQDPNRKITLPPRAELETSMEAVIHHFKLVTEGFHPPKGECYVPTESARGELGCYIVSDGGSMPYRIHFRSPSFVNLQALPVIGIGGLFADLVTVIASLDPVMGDVDR